MAYIPPNPNGQATKANSSPVVLASDQDLPLPSGAATSAKQDTGNTSAANIDTSTAAINTVVGAKTDAKSSATDATAITIMQVLKQISASVQAPPSQAVTNAGTFAVQATLQAGSALVGKVGIDQTTPGTTNAVAMQDGAGNALTSNSTTYTAKKALDGNLLGTLGTAFTTPGKVDVKAADGDVFVRQATAANLNMTEASAASSLTSLQLIDDPVFVDDAAYTLSTSKGNVIEGVAVETDGTDPSSVSAEGDAAAVRTDRNRRLLVNTAHPNLWTANDNQSTAQTNTSLKSAPGASLSLYITDVIISNGATAGDIRIVEDPAGTPVIKVPKIYVAINGGAVLHFNTPIRITANKAVGYTSTTVTTHSVQINGYTAP